MKQHKTLSKKIFIVVYLAVVVGCVVLDQLTKLWIFDGLLEGHPGNSVNVLGNFMRFYALYNEGAAFGIGQDDGANVVFFIITVIGVPLFCWLLWRSRERSICGQVGFAFIVGGTIGNAIDRAFIQSTEGQFFSGKVRDFISFSIFPPVFNVADSFLVIGVAMAILAIIVFDPDGLIYTIQAEKAEKAAASAQTNAERIQETYAEVDVEETDEVQKPSQTDAEAEKSPEQQPDDGENQ